MRFNYFAKLIKYMKNVYNIERGINKLSDGRKNPKVLTNLSYSITIKSTSLRCTAAFQSKAILILQRQIYNFFYINCIYAMKNKLQTME